MTVGICFQAASISIDTVRNLIRHFEKDCSRWDEALREVLDASNCLKLSMLHIKVYFQLEDIIDARGATKDRLRVTKDDFSKSRQSCERLGISFSLQIIPPIRDFPYYCQRVRPLIFYCFSC